jgi:hypothetical protein
LALQNGLSARAAPGSPYGVRRIDAELCHTASVLGRVWPHSGEKRDPIIIRNQPPKNIKADNR